jgi:tungstate transport system substrate-binding protein
MKKAVAPVLLLLLAGLACRPAGEENGVDPGLENKRLRMSTTTSTDNSGLMKVLLPPFERKYGVEVDVIPVGTGKALKLAENGDVDLVLVHAREAEDKFVEDGFGVDRRDVMHNDFLIVGSPEDPAGAGGSFSGSEALRMIGGSNAVFISRGDDSGTHKKELELWESGGFPRQEAYVIETGQGMGATLRIADEKRAYTLVDRGTWLAYKGKLDLIILKGGADPQLHNPYGIIAVNPERHPEVNYELAKLFIDYITGPEGQAIIDGFQVDGERLFTPDVLPEP